MTATFASIQGLLGLRDGHWYTTSLKIPGAHTTPDGRAVGIYCKPEVSLTPELQPGGAVIMRRVLTPARVVFQAPNGHDLMRLSGDRVERVEYPPEKLPDLQPLEEFDHLPDSRKATSWLKPGAKLTDLP